MLKDNNQDEMGLRKSGGFLRKSQTNLGAISDNIERLEKRSSTHSQSSRSKESVDDRQDVQQLSLQMDESEALISPAVITPRVGSNLDQLNF